MTEHMIASEMRIGTVLANGAIVIAASARNAHEWIILAMRPGNFEPYATWRCSRPGDGSDARWGHYFSDVMDATRDFTERT